MPSKAIRVVGAAAVVAALVGAPCPAWASDGSGSETPGPNPGIGASAGMPAGFGSAGESNGCTWEILNHPNSPSTPQPPGPAPTVIGGQMATIYVRTCGAAVDLVWVVPITGIAAVPGALAAVQKLLPAPNPIMVPPKNDLHGFAYTQVPLWWWLPASRWQPVSATATAINGPDTVSATATATPSVIQFNAGDGAGLVACAGPGVPFDDSLSLAAQSTPCEYTYRQSSSLSPSGTWPASWTIVWQVTWKASDGTGGALAPLQSTTTRALSVAEDQSVVVNPSS